MKIRFIAEKCTECGLCTKACIEEHDDRVARLSIENVEDKLKLYICQRCAKPACAYACTYEVIYREKEYGTIRILEDECQACHACYHACPFDAVFINPKNDIPAICDLCNGSPTCVKVCPTGALILENDKA